MYVVIESELECYAVGCCHLVTLVELLVISEVSLLGYSSILQIYGSSPSSPLSPLA